MLVDTCLFFNELRLLQLRFTLLENVVEKFVVVEGNRTFSGLRKPMLFAEYRDKFYQRWADKITYVAVDDFPSTNDPWERERHQRNAIQRGLAEINPAPDDVVLVSDCDELPNPSFLENDGIKRWMLSNHETAVFEQELYSFTVHWRHVRPWYGTRAILADYLLEPQMMRHTLGPRSVKELKIHNGGWSFSYFGGVKAIQDKVASYSHQEVNRPEYTNKLHVAESIRTGRSLVRGDGNKFVKVKGLAHLPAPLRDTPEQWPAVWFGKDSENGER